MTCPLCNSPDARIETQPYGRCPDTGYVDGGSRLICECDTWEMDEVEALCSARQ